MDIKLSEKILPAFFDSWRAWNSKQYVHCVEKGGRASSKSTTIVLKLIMRRMSTKTHAICCRKYAKTLRTSVRSQLIWAINHLNVAQYWKWSDKLSGSMELEYTPTGSKIYFEGADGDKIKGWKTHDMPTTDIFFEEITDFKTDEELSSIVLSILREQLPDNLNYTFFYAYNPPKRKSQWVNKKYGTQFIDSNTYVHYSNYLTNPKLPQEFIDEANICKARNKKRYDWEFLGKPIGSGIVPFDNLNFRKIEDEEFRTFCNIKQGNDWGYAVDPNAFVQWHYDKTRKKIYAMNEIYKVKMSNTELAEKLKRNNFNRTLTVADSAEPKSIAQMKSLNCNFVKAKKGQGSVEFGEKWLDELDEIVIDPNRTPNLAREFEGIDYAVDRFGNTTSRLEDKDNHGIDATRYAFESEMITNTWGF